MADKTDILVFLRLRSNFFASLKIEKQATFKDNLNQDWKLRESSMGQLIKIHKMQGKIVEEKILGKL